MAHHVCRKFGREFSAVRKAPQKLRRLAAVRQTHEAEIDLRRILDILEILARAGDEEVLAVQLWTGKARGNLPQNRAVHIIVDLRFLQQQAHVAAVALVPAVVVHIRHGANHLHHPRGCQNIFHALASRTFFSYARTSGSHAPSSGTPQRRQYSAQTSPKGMVFSSSCRTSRSVKLPAFCSAVISGVSRAFSRAFCTLRKPVTHAAMRLTEASK